MCPRVEEGRGRTSWGSDGGPHPEVRGAARVCRIRGRGGSRSSRGGCFGLMRYVHGSSKLSVPLRKITGRLHARCAGEFGGADAPLADARSRAGAERIV